MLMTTVSAALTERPSVSVMLLSTQAGQACLRSRLFHVFTYPVIEYDCVIDGVTDNCKRYRYKCIINRYSENPKNEDNYQNIMNEGPG